MHAATAKWLFMQLGEVYQISYNVAKL